ncbi:MAG: hypothetical protein WKF93_10185 [Acidimicrobiales bacterium]
MPDETLDDRWFARELPVLLAIGRLGTPDRQVNDDDVADAVGLSMLELGESLRWLHEGGYVASHRAGGMPFLRLTLTEKGRRQVGVWPKADDAVAAFLDALEAAADQAEDPDRKSRIRSAAAALRDVSTEAFGGALAAALAAGLGLS